jgi:hypothetical protein
MRGEGRTNGMAADETLVTNDAKKNSGETNECTSPIPVANAPSEQLAAPERAAFSPLIRFWYCFQVSALAREGGDEANEGTRPFGMRW